MATQTRAAISGKVCGIIADYLNAIDARADRALASSAEALLHPLGVATWPSDVTPQQVARWGLSRDDAARLLGGFQALGITL